MYHSLNDASVTRLAVAYPPEQVRGCVKQSEFDGELPRVLVHPVAMTKLFHQSVHVAPTDRRH